MQLIDQSDSTDLCNQEEYDTGTMSAHQFAASLNLEATFEDDDEHIYKYPKLDMNIFIPPTMPLVEQRGRFEVESEKSSHFHANLMKRRGSRFSRVRRDSAIVLL